MNLEIITPQQIQQRQYWISEISQLSGNFGADSQRLEQEITSEITRHGVSSLIGHLRLCGAIPEQYGHDTSEEKLYSKYTDVVIAQAYAAMGITSMVLKERADAADVECVTPRYSFVADAKAFRLSRTAKNQKDFKVQAMDGWKKGKPYAMVVCPVYQLPSRTSQIYQQAITRGVRISTYTHLSVLVRYAQYESRDRSIDLLQDIFKTVDTLNPSKIASIYWQAINRVMIEFDPSIRDVWIEEKKASSESIYLDREEALQFLASEREIMMKLSKEEAIREILKSSKIDNKIASVRSVSDNSILSIQ